MTSFGHQPGMTNPTMEKGEEPPLSQLTIHTANLRLDSVLTE